MKEWVILNYCVFLSWLRRFWRLGAFAGWCLAAMFGASLTSAAAGQQPGRIQLDDFATIVHVSEPQLSPDGKSIVFVVGRPNLKDDRIDSSLMLVDIASGAQRPLTWDRKGVSSPRWSPSGDRIAFLARALPKAAAPDASAESAESESSEKVSHGPKEQIFVLSMSGGDAQKVTDSPESVEQFAWSPDGRQLAYVAADEPPNKKAIEHHNDAFEVGDNDYLAVAATLPSHIWVVAADGGAARRLTSGAWSLPKSAPPSPPASPLSWSPDGKLIAFTRQATPLLGDSDQAVIATVEVSSGAIHKLTTHKAFEGFPLFSPDGSEIAYLYSRDGDPNNENEFFVAPAASGDGVDLTRAVDHNLARAIWMPDGKTLLVGGHDGTRVSLWLQPLEGAARKLDIGNVDPAWLFWIDMSVGNHGAIAFAGSTPTQPSELYYLASTGSVPRRLTDFNHTVASRALGQVEEIRWQGPDGFQEDGVVIHPPGFSKEKKYPLVLLIHGGPQASSTTSFSFLGQLLAAHDYVVFEPNYRGSDNLGNAYQRAIFNDAGDGPGRDVMAGLDALEKRGFVDTSKIAVSGWSYGGYMTSWMIGHYPIWKAAVSGAAVNDMVHETNLSDFNVTNRYSFGGSPWVGDFMKAYREQSPITYAAQIKTPTLILSDTGDARVPITQSYLMFHALKDNGVPVKFIAYPVPGHFPGDPVRSMDIFRRWAEWMDQYLK
jgi:dipeptidyl aminopeptidase/acylaminoacyl peptidase